MKFSRVLLFIPFVIFLTACGATSNPTQQPQASLTPAMAATATVLEPTSTPAPTAIPGEVTIPISSMRDEFPWFEWNPIAVPSGAYYFFNLQNPPFDNLSVRKAFAAATDNSVVFELVSDLYSNRAYPESYRQAGQMSHPEILGRDLSNDIGISFDPEQARQYLAEAGYSDPANFPSVTLVVSYAGDIAPGARQRIGELTASMWEENLGIPSVDVVVITSSLEASVRAGEPDIYMLGWITDYLDPYGFLAPFFYTDDVYNWTGYSSPVFDGLIDETGGITSAVERQLLFIQIEELIVENEVLAIPLFHFKSDYPQ